MFFPHDIRETVKQNSLLSSEKLLNKGYQHVNSNNPDSALFYYTVVVNRYNKDMSSIEKEWCAKGYIGMWTVYFLFYYDYSKSYESLMKAESIYKEINKHNAIIPLNMGCIYQSIGEQSQDTEPYKHAFKYYKEAFASASKNNDKPTLSICFTNLLTVAYVLQRIDDVKKEWDFYKTFNDDSRKDIVDFNKSLYSAYLFMRNKDYEKAFEEFDRQEKILRDKPSYSRFYISGFINKAKVFMETKQYEKAIMCLKCPEELSDTFGMKDAWLDIYRILAKCYKETGRFDIGNKYTEKYFLIKDSLLNYRQIVAMNEMRAEYNKKNV